MKNKKLSDKHKQKLKEAKLNSPVRYWQGRNRPEETKIKVSEGLKRYYENKRSCQVV